MDLKISVSLVDDEPFKTETHIYKIGTLSFLDILIEVLFFNIHDQVEDHKKGKVLEVLDKLTVLRL